MSRLSSKALALTLLKRYHRAVNDGMVILAAYIDKDFKLDDNRALHSVYDHWHTTKMPMTPELLQAQEQFVDLYESGLDNHPEREGAFYDIMYAFRDMLKQDYKALRELAGDYSEYLDTDGELTHEVEMAFKSEYEPNPATEPLSEEKQYNLYQQAIKTLEANPVKTSTDNSPNNAEKLTHFSDYLALKEFFEQ
ncbi:hypothetical protein [Thiosulfatimonas sediminis]|nr:hypothetical protein [Thiosulfatimonas sediminis]